MFPSSLAQRYATRNAPCSHCPSAFRLACTLPAKADWKSWSLLWSNEMGNPQGEMKHIHMIGIGGSAMAPLAGMLRERRYQVTGSDAGVYPPASTLLESLGIPYASAFEARNL